jgi:periplasmic protein TonB
MKREPMLRGLPLALLAVVLSCAWMGPAMAADEDDEEPVDLGSYDGSQNRPTIQRPTISIERPELRTDFQVELAPPTTNSTLPTLNLNAAMVRPSQPQIPPPQAAQAASARPTPPPARTSAQPPPAGPSTQQRTVTPPPQTRAATPPPSQPAATSAGPRIVPISMDPPSYPVDAQRSGIQGYVTLAFTIRPDGSVDEIEVIEDQPRGTFRRAAQRAVRRWRFEPILVNGRATEYRVQHRIDFTLEN